MKEGTIHIFASLFCILIIVVMITNPDNACYIIFPASFAYGLYYGNTRREYKDLPMVAPYLPYVLVPLSNFFGMRNNDLFLKLPILMMLIVLCLHIINVKRIITHSQSISQSEDSNVC